MTETPEKDPLDVIAENMIKEIEDAEQKDKEIEERSVSSDDNTEDVNIVEEEYPSEDIEKETKKQKRTSYQNRQLANLQRAKSKADEENRLLAEENLRLRQEYELAVQKAHTLNDVSMTHYQNKILADQQYLQEQYKKAFEMNDVDEMLKINKAIAKLASQEEAIDSYNLMKLQEQQQYQQYQQPYYPQQAYPQNYNNYQQSPQMEEEVEISPHEEDWAKRNPWIIPQSPDYDPAKVSAIINHSRWLDESYIRQGREDLIRSEEYYNALDNYAQQTFGDEIQTSHSQRAPRNMEQSFSRNTRSPIAPVRKAASGNYGSSNNVQLTDIDKAMINEMKRFGVTPQQFAKEKIKLSDRMRQTMESGDLGMMQRYGIR